MIVHFETHLIVDLQLDLVCFLLIRLDCYFAALFVDCMLSELESQLIEFEMVKPHWAGFERLMFVFY